MSEDFGAALPTWGFAFSPLVVGDLVLINPGADAAALVALERSSGKVRWKAFDVGGGYSSPVLAELAGDRQAIFFTRSPVWFSSASFSSLARPATSLFSTNVVAPSSLTQ